MPDNVLAFMIALGVALILTPAVIAFARRTGALDKPDARKVHERPIPRIGGIGIYAAFMVSILVQLLFVDLTPEYMMSLIGLMQECPPLPPSRSSSWRWRRGFPSWRW